MNMYIISDSVPGVDGLRNSDVTDIFLYLILRPKAPRLQKIAETLVTTNQYKQNDTLKESSH
jgi:hypothetical protein